MAEYKKTSNGRYMRDGKLVSANDVPAAARETLEGVDVGQVVDDTGLDVESEDSGTEPAPGGVKSDVDTSDDDEDVNNDSDLGKTGEKGTPEDSDDNDDDSDNDSEDDESDEADEGAKAASKSERKSSGKPKQARMSQIAPTATPQSEPGMGFPRKNGKTVDLFDGKTPHTHVRNVNGIMVPLSEENFTRKTDADILKQLDKMGF